MIKHFLALLILLLVSSILFYEIIIASSVYFVTIYQEIATLILIIITIKAFFDAVLEYIHPISVKYIYTFLFITTIVFLFVFIICYKLNISMMLYFLVSPIIIIEISSFITKRIIKSKPRGIIISLSSFVSSIVLIYLILYFYFFVIPVPYSITNIRNPTPYHIQQVVIRKFNPVVSRQAIYIYKVNPFLLSFYIKVDPFKSKVADCQVFSRMFYSAFKYYGYHPEYVYFFSVKVKKDVKFPFVLFPYYLSMSLINNRVKPLHVAVYMNGKVYDFKIIDYENNNTYVVEPSVKNIKFYSRYYKSYAICNQFMCRVYSF